MTVLHMCHVHHNTKVICIKIECCRIDEYSD